MILSFGSQVMAAAPAFDQWTVIGGTIAATTCQAGYSCGSAITDIGYFQRMVPEETSGTAFFQTIITDFGSTYNASGLQSATGSATTDIQTTPGLFCPDGYICGDKITAPDFIQLEFTDGSNIWFNTIKSATPLILDTIVTTEAPTPLHLLHTQAGLTLKPGQHLIAAGGDSLAEQIANLQLDRTKLTSDPAYIELNQQGAAEQKIYRNVVDGEIAGVATGAEAKLSAQLNVPLNVPDSYALQVRVLTGAGWANFVADEHNHLAAANKLDSGYCPEVGSDLYQNEFGAGSECLQLTIQDGGPNDGDGTADGTIAVTIGPVLKATELAPTPLPLQEDESTLTVEASQTTGTTAPTQGGGGAWPWWMSLALLFRLGRSKRN